jgi:periplasmic divalent cation tolerance protein
MQESASLLIIYTTFASEAEARLVVRPMVEDGWVACANMYRMESLYRWEGDIVEDHEVGIILKSTPAMEAQVRNYLSEHHPYATPCILTWKVAVNAPYLAWVEGSIRPID